MKLKVSILFLVLILALYGCDDLFDVEPSTSVTSEEVTTTADGVETLRESMYNQIREQFGYTTGYFIHPSSFSDELNLRPGATRNQALNNAVEGDGGRDHISFWSDTYDVVQDLNLMIGEVDDEQVDMDEAQLMQYRAEAYTLRAFMFHSLARTMGYEPGTEGAQQWDQSIVLQTSPVIEREDIEHKERATVDEVYDQIRSDLDEAESRFTEIGGFGVQNRANEAFMHGVRARVELYAGEWEAAAQSAEDAINAFPGGLVSDAQGIADMFVDGGGLDEEGNPIDRNPGQHQEALMLLTIDPDTEASTGGDSFTNNGPAGYTSDQWGAQLPTQLVIDMYEEDDYRFEGWYEDCYNYQDDEAFGNCDAVNDEGLSLLKFNGAKGSLVDDMPYMRLAEMYLIRAEAEAKISDNPGDGIGYLNELREARNAEAKDAESMEDFEDLVLRERVRELASEGHRFFDLKRLERDIQFPDGGTKFRTDSHRIISPVPLEQLGINENLDENPGY